MTRKQQGYKPSYARTFEELAEDVFLSTNPRNALYNCHSELFARLMEYRDCADIKQFLDSDSNRVVKAASIATKQAREATEAITLSWFLDSYGKEAVINYILLVSHACGEPDTPRFKTRNKWDTSLEVAPTNPVAYAASIN